ncbi:EscF/YscF/HrpA family type III secretion system needle major subunit [Ramlibacter sp. MAHUQ-53]|uniref:EscF/YscF/HrpA family type III secretion system needle major subunit n=1 Tax=unclassified Ramlibacter TaxID=2617605 RepID=UPI003645512B
MAASNSISMESLNTTLTPVYNSAETKLLTRIEGLGENPSTGEMMLMQQEMTRWTMLVQIHSTLVKDFKDAMQGVISKMN